MPQDGTTPEQAPAAAAPAVPAAAVAPPEPTAPEELFAFDTPLESPPISPPPPAAALPAATSAAPAPEPITPAPAQATHPAALVQQARDFGLTDAVIAGASTGDLAGWCYQKTQELRQQAHWLASQQQLAAQQQQLVRPGIRPDEVEAPEIVDAEIVDWVRKTVDKKTARLQQMETELAQTRQALQQAEGRRAQSEQQRYARMLDAGFEKLGKSYEKYFGKGTMGQVSRTEAQRRVMVLAQAQIDSFDKLNPATLVSDLRRGADELFALQPAPAAPAAAPAPTPAEAYASLNAGTPAAPAPAAPRISQAQWDQGGLARPNGVAAGAAVDDDPLDGIPDSY